MKTNDNDDASGFDMRGDFESWIGQNHNPAKSISNSK